MIAPDRVAFSVFGLDIMWYGLLIGLGFFLATLICYFRAKEHDIKPDFILDLVIFMVPSAIIGARAYYVIFSWEDYAGDWAKILDTRNGGLAIHGGLIACFLVAYFVCRHHKVNFLNAADLVAPTIALAQSIGRWGNFFNEEAHGGPTDLPWAQIIDGVGYHPTFLYESIWCFLLFWFLLWMDRKHRKFNGQIVCLYGILYSIERFFVEGLRTDSLMIGPLRQAQVISICLIAGLSVFYYILMKNERKRETIK
ncbi:MAG: prolipoprotein diacylglyceryl transferase [Firmicutes bacterium]|nr:prolipoprotein diacylglyceryl transferase [Bacillota bacterium]MDD7602920.1 prolipoprotein diacylglyceryl transferase [Bacillota bacterium]MDY5857499.1 prolipoprotein diacylglyceryl transferase [Anaerovoracaceae bacterium]